MDAQLINTIYRLEATNWFEDIFQKFLDWFSGIRAEFINNFITDNRYMYFLNGLVVTLLITLGSLILGIVLGVVVAIIRSTHDKIIDEINSKPLRTILKLLNSISNIYLTIIRGTPVVVQLLIAYYVIFISLTNGTVVAILAFGINSGAYVAEIIRSGIMSIDNGQFEAGRSLGFNYIQTMLYIVMPQALKNVLPALANEFIVLLKETSVAGYVGLQDLTKAGNTVRGITFSAFMPLFAVALIYLVLVIFFNNQVSKLERRLRNSER